jgi:hypothetical protein
MEGDVERKRPELPIRESLMSVARQIDRRYFPSPEKLLQYSFF